MAVALLLLVLLGDLRGAKAQRPADAILAGVDSVDAEISLKWDAKIPNLNEDVIRSRLQTVFELELRQRGIIVSKLAPNYLTVSLTMLYNQTGIVAYAYGLSLSEPGFPKRAIAHLLVLAVDSASSKRWAAPRTRDSTRALHAAMWDEFLQVYFDTSKTSSTTGWVITWTGPNGVATVGRDNLSASLEQETAELAQDFVNAYLAVHPKR